MIPMRTATMASNRQMWIRPCWERDESWLAVMFDQLSLERDLLSV